MESANFHHHQQQQDDHHLLVDSSGYGLSCYQNPILNGTSSNISRDLKEHINNNIFNTPSMAQDLGFSWSSSNNHPNISMENFMTQELQHLARIISSSPTSSIKDLHLQSSPSYISKNDHQQQFRYVDSSNNNQDMLLATFANGCQIKGGQVINQITSSGDQSISYSSDHTNTCSRGTFSQIFPTINISSLNQSSISSSAFDMNLPALDLFGSPRFNGSFSHNPNSLNAHNLGSLFKDTCLSYGLDQMHQPNHHRQEVCPSKISPAFITKSTTEAKRAAGNYMDSKTPQAIASKKSKLESRPSCAPLKVRKEKLGDRISALQQMVAPFGKTDTASVLMEAIGYIKFLQNQVETLSVPYMNSTHTDKASTRGGSMKDGNEEAMRDLRSRGLCLVPLSCLSYVTYGDGGGWHTS